MEKQSVLRTLACCALAAIMAGCQPAVQQQASDQLDLNHPLAFSTSGGRPALVKCSERIVEIPFVHRNLPYPFRGRVLDVGCRESEISFENASLGFEAWGIDIRPQLVPFAGLRYVQGDICSYPLPDAYFDVVIALSTIEHIGLMVYENRSADPQGDLHALQAIRRIIKPKGTLLLTVPFGVRGLTAQYRVYDHQSLQDLLGRADFTVQTEDYWYKEVLRWIPAPWERAEKMDSISSRVRAVACVVARPQSPRGGGALLRASPHGKEWAERHELQP